VTTLHHLVVDVELTLVTEDFNHFQDTSGRPLSRDEARRELLKALEAGIKFLPVGDCPSFSPQLGCPGHPVQ
jgi:hypothetical protein